MGFQIAYHTDIGIKKKTNQDALLIKTARTPDGPVGLFIVCDGMGGLSHGELASASVINGMSAWFDHELPDLLQSKMLDSEMETSLRNSLQAVNEKILDYGEAANIRLGTTITALLVIYENYYLVQIGDSRAYHIHETALQLTRDQTLVAREIERGNLTAEQAKHDPRRNVLLQCVGATKEIEVVITKDEAVPGTYLLCTDGFYHQISNDELLGSLRPERQADEKQLKETVIDLVELVKQRKEPDNISVIAVKID